MVETRSTKRRKTQSYSTICDAGDGVDVDRLSGLPDDVLHKILSCLPMDQAVRTNVLSKRWAALWLSFPELDFMSVGTFQIGARWMYGWHHEFCLLNTKQADSIPSMMCSRARLMSSLHGCGATDLRSLRLMALMSPNSISRILRSAVQLKVQELDLDIAMLDDFQFPTRLAKSESLRVLKINAHLHLMRLPCRPASTLTFSRGFRSLEVLQISGFNSTSFDTVTEKSFPSLKILHLSRCWTLGWIRVHCLNLREFKLKDCPRLVGLEVYCEKLEELTVLSCLNRCSKSKWHQSLVKLRTPKLRKLYWSHNGFTRHCHLENMDFLMDTCVDSLGSSYYPSRALKEVNSMAEFMPWLSHSVSMSLGKRGVKALASLSGPRGRIRQPFINLLKLELQSTGFITAIPTILKSTPFLEDLTLLHDSTVDEQKNVLAPSRWLNEEREWEACCLSHQSFLRHLKVVSLVGLSRGNLVGTAKFLLKHAVSLRHMDFSLKCAVLEGFVVQEKMKSEILALASNSGTNINFRDAPKINFEEDLFDEGDMHHLT